jgi:hypothetical protein
LAFFDFERANGAKKTHLGYLSKTIRICYLVGLAGDYAMTAASGGSLLLDQYRQPFAILKPKNRKNGACHCQAGRHTARSPPWRPGLVHAAPEWQLKGKSLNLLPSSPAIFFSPAPQPAISHLHIFQVSPVFIILFLLFF